MRLSQAYELTTVSKRDWFDPILDYDARLFVDPYLIARDGEWDDAHLALVNHFEHVFALVASSPGPQSLAGQRARSLLTFPEPQEFRLGYTKQGVGGSGSGAGVAETLTQTIGRLLALGLPDPHTHFEAVGLFTEGIGADRISDACCTILRKEFAEYTASIAAEEGLPVRQFRFPQFTPDLEAGRWVPAAVALPFDPETQRPVILVPERFLNDLPSINSDAWWESTTNAEVRREFNARMFEGAAKRPAKATLVALAEKNVSGIASWIQGLSDSSPGRYDLARDPHGRVAWHDAALAFSTANPLHAPEPQTTDDFYALIDELVRNFTRFMQSQGGWRLAWNDDGTQKHEEAIQLALMGMGQGYARDRGIEMDREVNLGRGPVDFKFSNGAKFRALMEVKKLHSPNLWHGLDEQLPSYLESDATTAGWYVAVQYTSTRGALDRARQLPKRVAAASLRWNRRLRLGIIDVRRKPSASKI